nr:putative ribonuclease H-like domain-containing protein [Tanacetum cinerariifolium]
DNPHQNFKGKGVVDSRCSRHMTGNKAYLVEYQDFNGGHVAFRGSKGQITENKANITAGLKEANNSADEHAQEYFVLPLWSSYTLTVKSSKAKNGDEKLNGDTGSKTNKEPVDEEDQPFLEELERLKRQEKEADDAAGTLRKMFCQGTKDLLLQAGAARASSTNYVNTASTQEEGIDYDEVFAPMARIEAIRIFLAFASYVGFIVYQMDVKSAFLYGKIDEEVYFSQPPCFIDPKFPKKVYKVVKALYSLHQAPRAWYATLSTFLVQSGYRRGLIDKTMFIKKDKKDIMLVKQNEDGIFISQDKYVAKILKKFDFKSVKTASTPIETKKPLVKDEEAADVDVTPKTSHLHDVKRIFRHHFIRDAYEKKLIQVLKIHTDDNVADLLTKTFDVSFSKKISLGKEHVSKDERKKAKTGINIEKESISTAGKTLSAATLAVSTVNVQEASISTIEIIFLLSVKRMKEDR